MMIVPLREQKRQELEKERLRLRKKKRQRANENKLAQLREKLQARYRLVTRGAPLKHSISMRIWRTRLQKGRRRSKR